MKLEICANSLTSALTAQEAGADRVELCQNLKEGGITPSYGQIQLARKRLIIDLYVLIRPRSGDFLYSAIEFEIMKADILICKKLGCDGIVIGILKANGNIDIQRTKELVELAYPMSVTFHRAFDVCRNPERALVDIISCGCQRILTSGLKSTAIEGVDNINKLIELANNQIIIMPGSGIKSNNIKFIKELIPAQEWHASAKSNIVSNMTYHNPELKNTENPVIESDKKEIMELVKKLRS